MNLNQKNSSIFSVSIDLQVEDYLGIFSKKIYEGAIIMLVNGGHGFKVLSDVEMIEVKQGPYSLSSDKVKFDKIDEKKITIKK